MKLTLRRFTGAEVALAVFRLPDDSFAQQKIAQERKLELDGKANGYDWVAPHPDAEFKFAAGGIPALDTADGYPGVGDCWEEPDEDGGTRLVIQAHDEIGFEYEQAVADDPKQGTTSRVKGLRVSSRGNRQILRKYSLDALPDLSIDEAGFAEVRDEKGDILSFSTVGAQIATIDAVAPNHRSVTFDAASTVGVMATASTLTVAHTTANQSDRYMVASANWGTGASQTLSTIQNDPTGTNQTLVALTSALVTITSRKGDLWGIIAPTVGTLNVVFTWSANTNGASSVWTYYGVDQTTPYYAVTTATGTSTAPALTLTGGATGDASVTSTVWNSATATNTPDATWTNDWNSVGNNAAGNAGSHIAGASSVTRTDTLSTSVVWGMTGASLLAAAAAGHPTMRRHLNAPTGRGVYLRPTEMGHDGVVVAHRRGRLLPMRKRRAA